MPSAPQKRQGPNRTVWIEDEMWEKLRQLAFDRHVTISEVVRQAINEGLPKLERTAR